MDSDGPTDDVITFDPATQSIEELRAIVEGRSTKLPRVLALAALGRLKYDSDEKAAIFGRLLADERESLRVRLVAATELGRIDTPRALEMLAGARGAKEPALRRAVALGMGRHSAQQAGDLMRDYLAREGTTDPAVRWAATLRAYVTRDERLPLLEPVPIERVPPPDRNARDMLIEPADKELARRVAAAASQALPGTRYHAESALYIRCGPRNMMFLRHDAFADSRSFGRLLDGRALAGVVAVQETVETGGWDPKYVVLTHPKGNGEIEILIPTSRGQLSFAGSGRVTESTVSFEIRAVPRPGAVPIELAGTLGDGVLEIEAARSSLNQLPKVALTSRRPVTRRPSDAER